MFEGQQNRLNINHVPILLTESKDFVRSTKEVESSSLVHGIFPGVVGERHHVCLACEATLLHVEVFFGDGWQSLFCRILPSTLPAMESRQIP